MLGWKNSRCHLCLLAPHAVVRNEKRIINKKKRQRERERERDKEKKRKRITSA